MSFQDVGKGRHHPIFSYHRSEELAPTKAPLEQGARLPRHKRGVRPHLSTQCPVSGRAIMDDVTVQESVAPSSASQSSWEDSGEDLPPIPPVTPSPLSSRSRSVYAELTNELFNFQVSLLKHRNAFCLCLRVLNVLHRKC